MPIFVDRTSFMLVWLTIIYPESDMSTVAEKITTKDLKKGALLNEVQILKTAIVELRMVRQELKELRISHKKLAKSHK